MDELNTELKTQREALGLSIQDLFRRTRINTEFLEALEEENYDVLPEAYIKLFLKRYAQEVRLDENDIIRKFEKLRWKARVSTESFSPRGSEGTPGWVVGVGAALVLGMVVAAVILQSESTPPSATRATKTPPRAGSALAVLSIASPPLQNMTPSLQQPVSPETSGAPDGKRFAGASTPNPAQDSADERVGDDPDNGITSRDTPPQSSEQIPALPDPQTDTGTFGETVSVNTAVEADTPTDTTEPIGAAQDLQDENRGERVVSAYSLSLRQDLVASSSVLRLSVVGLEPTQIAITSDGEPIFDGLVGAGRKASWNARDRFLIEIRKGSGVRLQLQDEPLPEVGAGGRRVRLFISRSSIWVEEIESADLASSTSSTP